MAEKAAGRILSLPMYPELTEKQIQYVVDKIKTFPPLSQQLMRCQADSFFLRFVIFHQAAYQDYMPDFSKLIHVNSVSTALIHEIILTSIPGYVGSFVCACLMAFRPLFMKMGSKKEITPISRM